MGYTYFIRSGLALLLVSQLVYANTAVVAKSLYAKVHSKYGCFLVYKGAVTKDLHDGRFWCGNEQKVEFFDQNNKKLLQEKVLDQDACSPQDVLLKTVQHRLAQKDYAVSMYFYPHKGPWQDAVIVYNKRGHKIAFQKQDKNAQAAPLQDGQVLAPASLAHLSDQVSNPLYLGIMTIKRGVYLEGWLRSIALTCLPFAPAYINPTSSSNLPIC